MTKPNTPQPQDPSLAEPQTTSLEKLVPGSPAMKAHMERLAALAVMSIHQSVVPKDSPDKE